MVSLYNKLIMTYFCCTLERQVQKHLTYLNSMPFEHEIVSEKTLYHVSIKWMRIFRYLITDMIQHWIKDSVTLDDHASLSAGRQMTYKTVTYGLPMLFADHYNLCTIGPRL